MADEPERIGGHDNAVEQINPKRVFPNPQTPYSDVDIGISPMDIVPTGEAGPKGHVEASLRLGYTRVSEPELNRARGLGSKPPDSYHPWIPPGRRKKIETEGQGRPGGSYGE